MTEPEWVPASCTLPTAEQPLRVAEWDVLFSERLTAVHRTTPLRVRLELAGAEGVAERVRDLAEREGGCCSFFTFTTTGFTSTTTGYTSTTTGDTSTTTGDKAGVHLDIEVDRTHEPVLNALADRAADALAGARG